MIKLTPQIISKNTGAKSEARGRIYFLQGRVLKFKVVESSHKTLQMTADVSGSYAAKYQVNVSVGVNQARLVMYGDCSCPVGFNCKHVAAVCFHYMANHTEHSLVSKKTAGHKWLEKLKESTANHHITEPSEGVILHYYLNNRPHEDFDIKKHKYLKSGKLSAGNVVNKDKFASQAYEYSGVMQKPDIEVAELLATLAHPYRWTQFDIKGRLGFHFLKAVAVTGRCYFTNIGGKNTSGPLTFNTDPYPLQFNWGQKGKEQVILQTNLPQNFYLYPTQPPCFVDPNNNSIYAIDTQVEIDILKHLLNPQAINETEATDLFKYLVDHPKLPSLSAPPHLQQRDIKVQPIPTLIFNKSITERENITNRQSHYCLHLTFAYEDQSFEFYKQQNPVVVHTSERFLNYHRQTKIEVQAKSQLENLGFISTQQDDRLILKAPHNNEQQQALLYWQDFFDQQIPELKARGWQVIDNPGCNFSISSGSQIEVNSKSEAGWFSLRFDVEINGSPQPLVPLISHLLTEFEAVDDLPENLILNLQDDQYIKVNKQEISPILNTLFELYDSKNKDELKISLFDIHLLDDNLVDLNNKQIKWHGSKQILALAQKIKTFQGIEKVSPPKALAVALRDYQETGLNWLNFLHHFKFSGILADDMGLGKTIQTLAHLSRLKEKNLLKGPNLIIVPTSLIANWKNEIIKFTPNLNFLVFYGSDRASTLKQLKQKDLVITSYALAVRDREIHQAISYDHIILDEAQKIKNPKTKMAQVIGSLKAENRLALSGTPIENHLGELWSIFNFLMPGFLKNLTQFKTFYQTPIEKEQDSYKQNLLNKRIKPFILRRKKEDVLDELPEKTEIIKRTQFAPPQAKLYESIRLSMEKKVRDAIADKGLNKSHITILDALLKLRQVCCDPSLLKLKQAQKLQASAKLELFLDLLDELLGEQHKVLVFSQFTSMLAILEREIKARNITYTKLTGASRNREQIIESFTQGQAEVFLISLKAGGIGLNLVEADTVIHYDPWWNPAVENQATDRAHRIGQDKSVFVYKLIVENTIEEKIIALQAKKQKLQDGIYQTQENQQEQKLSGAELINLLQE